MVESRNLLLTCGILATILFIGTDVIAGLLYPGYNFIDQSISELSALGAPTRSLVVPLNILYNVLLIAFVVGVWVSAGYNRLLRVTAVLILANVIVTLIWVFFPMHLGETANSMNVLLGAVSMMFFLLAIGFGAAAYCHWFRFFSVGILVLYLILTIFGVMANTHHVGAQERIMTYSYVLWLIVLSTVLLRKKNR